MFKVKVITIGKVKELWLKQALAEYEKRLTQTMEIEWVLLEKDLKQKVLQEKNYITLDLKGEPLSSESFSKNLFSKWGSRPTFVIGGAEGLDPEIIARATHSLCFSKLTFTHQMVRLILLEQLYRALEIEKNSSYHK